MNGDFLRFFFLVFMIFLGLPGLAMFLAWSAEQYETSRATRLRRATRGARPGPASRRRAPHPRHDPCAAYADRTRIHTVPTLSSALRRPDDRRP